jgi:hypothetical protein
MEWLDLVQIFLQLAACYACFQWGRVNGIGVTIEALLHKKIITEEDLDSLSE